MRNKLLAPLTLICTLLVAPLVSATTLTLYSGRGESLVQPIIAQFEKETGIKVNVRYGGTAELAVLLQEEGRRSPADVFWGQDAGAMGAVSRAELLARLPADVYENLPSIYKSVTGNWVATSGRARLFAFSPERAPEAEHPQTFQDLTDARFKGRVGWAPTNGSFQSFLTALRVQHGDEKALEWLEGMKGNDVKAFRNNAALLQALADGEVDYVLVNNYYLPRYKANDANYPVAQAFFKKGDIGNLMNVAGVAVVRASDNQDAATQFVRFLISSPAQEYFASQVNEYPVIDGVTQNALVEPYDEALEASPAIDLDQLSDLEGTLTLLRRAGLI